MISTTAQAIAGMNLMLSSWLQVSTTAKPQLLSKTPLCLQNQYHLGDSYKLPTPAATEDTTWAISGA